MRKEDLSFVLSVLRDKPIMSAPSDWYAVLGFLELNKIAGYFYNRARAAELHLLQSVERKLSGVLRMQAERNEAMRAYIQIVSAALKKSGVPFAFLKGTVLSNANLRVCELLKKCAAPSPALVESLEAQQKQPFYAAGERVSNDIDILINPEHIGVVSKALQAEGFINGYYDFAAGKVMPLDRREVLSRRMNRGETAPFMLALQGSVLPFVEVDVNFSLGYLPTGDDALRKKMLTHPVDYSGEIAGGLRSLQVGDFFLHLVLHQYKESTLYSMVLRNKDVELYKLLDIYLFLQRGYIDIYSFADAILLNGVQKQAYCVLAFVAELFGDLPLGGLLERIRPQETKYCRQVFDPASNKTYRFGATAEERVRTFDKEALLQEVDHA